MAKQNILRQLKKKSAKTIWVRGGQELLILSLSMTGGWRRIEKSVHQQFQNKNATIPDILPGISQLYPKDRIKMTLAALRILSREFLVLNHLLLKSDIWPWNTDWRFDHTWPLKNFKSYTYHEDRSAPYDVKYPWELSRLSFLLPLALLPECVQHVLDILTDWRRHNPFARSVNWHPMEASMRAINLVLLLNMLKDKAEKENIRNLLETVALHGEFIFRTVEYTDNRGNHFAANIVALFLTGMALEGFYPPAAGWKKYAESFLEDEILRQFTVDGVNFEKSTAYHKMVTELFLLARLARQKPFCPEAENRLKSACRYMATVTAPDKLIPLIGDTDDARVLAFDLSSPRDPLALQTLASVLFGELPPLGSLHHFEQGGVIIVREKESYLFFDVGSVGQNGFGGHGHNDLLSFELHLEGHPLIIDPGCPTYAGDKTARNLFRGTGYHNGLMMDGKEIAAITGPFRIANTARPHSVSCRQEKNTFVLSAGHTGYAPDDHRREIFFTPDENLFTCHDHVIASGRRRIDRYLHFSPEVTLRQDGKVDGGKVVANLHHFRFEISGDALSRAHILQGRASRGYGHVTEAPILLLSAEISAPTRLTFTIKKL